MTLVNGTASLGREYSLALVEVRGKIVGVRAEIERRKRGVTRQTRRLAKRSRGTELRPLVVHVTLEASTDWTGLLVEPQPPAQPSVIPPVTGI